MLRIQIGGLLPTASEFRMDVGVGRLQGSACGRGEPTSRAHGSRMFREQLTGPKGEVGAGGKD
eukprot:5825818-Pleurochrysis_carterae.AAC.2